MSIIAVSFFLMVAITFVLYYILPSRFRWVALLAASIVFFIKGCSIKLFALTLFMTSIAWLGGLLLGRINQQLSACVDDSRTVELTKRRNIVSVTAIICEMVILIILKNNAFFINNTAGIFNLFGLPHNMSVPSWPAPLGLSYYTLILIGYILDVSWGTSSPQKNPAKFLLFSTYFPQMTSGPFTRYNEMENKLFTGQRLSYKNLCFGLQRVLWGLFKKLVIAERLSVIVSTIYSNYDKYPGFFIFIAVIGYTLLVYADFSGCMDIIIGTSQLFGITLPENFKTPFFSTNLSEVWRRWHITLGFWVKDYLLYPVLKSDFMQKIRSFCKKRFSKKTSKSIPTYVGMFITWFTVGFWHGGTWKFIFGSGLFFFVMIVVGQLLEPFFQKVIRVLNIKTDCFSWRLFQRLRTFMLFAASVSFGRATSLMTGFKMWGAAFKWNPWILFDNSLYKLGLDREDFWIMVYALLLFLLVSVIQQKGSVREMLAEQNIIFRWIILLAAIFAVLILGKYGPGYNAAAFIYGGF